MLIEEEYNNTLYPATMSWIHGQLQQHDTVKAVGYYYCNTCGMKWFTYDNEPKGSTINIKPVWYKDI